MTLSAFPAVWFSLSVYKLRCDIRRELSAKEFLMFYLLYILVPTRFIDELRGIGLEIHCKP